MMRSLFEQGAGEAGAAIGRDTGRRRVLLIGALPPPNIGPTMANLRLSTSRVLQERFVVRFLDVSDRRSAGNMGRFDAGNVFLGLKHSAQFLGLLGRFRPEVVYLGISQGTWGWVRDLCFAVPSLLASRAVVLHLRGSEFRGFYESMTPPLRAVTRWALRRASRVIVLGQGLRGIFDGLVDADRIRVIPNGIAFQEFDRVPAISGDGATGRRLLFLGSLRERKGVHLLLEALGLVVKQYPDIRATIAGDWRTDADRRRADAILDRNHLRSRCCFPGEVSGEEKIRLFRSHDLFVFPPVEPEGLPWVILEAMSAGLPVVTTRQGAIHEVVEHGQTGLIVEPVPSAVAEGICAILADPENARAMGARGRRRVEACFNEDAYFHAIADTFEEAARPGARSGPGET